jgi:hypothetical protein
MVFVLLESGFDNLMSELTGKCGALHIWLIQQKKNRITFGSGGCAVLASLGWFG